MEILQLLKGSQFHPLTQINDTKLFIHNIDITTKVCSNKFIRNLIQPSNLPAAISYWNSQYGEINWRGAWLVGGKLLIHNKVKEISYKICHNVYPAKKTLERFKLNIDYKFLPNRTRNRHLPLLSVLIQKKPLDSYTKPNP